MQWRSAFLIVLAVISASASQITSAEQSPTYRALHPQSSFDTKPVAVSFGNTIYNIPRDYLAGVTQPTANGSYASFTIYVLLPDLAPRTPKNASAFDQPGWHDQLRALVEYGKVFRPKEEVLRSYLSIEKRSENDFKVVGGKYKLYDLPHVVPHEIYTASTPHGLFLFTCDRQSDYKIPFSPICAVMEDIRNNVRLIYHFSRDHLMEATDIDDKLRALLDSFARK